MRNIFSITLALLLVLFTNSFVSAEEKPDFDELSKETGISVEELEKRWAEYELNDFNLANSESNSIVIGEVLEPSNNNGFSIMSTSSSNWHYSEIVANYRTEAHRDFWWLNNWTSSAVTSTKNFNTRGNYPISEISATIKIYGPKGGSYDYTVTGQKTDRNVQYHQATVVITANSSKNAYSLGSFKWVDTRFGTITQTQRVNH